MEITINEEKLQNKEINEFSIKARAILINENNQILIANYGNVILLPGGKVDKGESIFDAITRELNEELGQDYNSDELEFFTTINYYQKNYPKRDGTFQNRLVLTHYFIGKLKEIKINLQKLTQKEQKDNFKLELISLEKLEDKILNNKNNNPRNIYFQKELLVVLDNYKNIKQNIIKKIK